MEQLVNFIIRPPRAEYSPDSDLLEQEFMLKGKWYQRKDLEVKNSRGDILKCSHYMPLERPEGKPLPCVIYCHGNSGCRADASEAAIILLPSNITVFTLDFSGSGLSGGEHVTLGWNEKDDLKAVVDFLRTNGNVSLIGLWGRSMGAVTSLMYGAEDPSIAGMVLDSPFSDLVDLMMELVDAYKFRLPKFTVKFAIQYMRRAIQKKAKFDIMDLNTIKVAKCCFVPVLFGHAMDDDFIHPHHSERINEAYVGDKNIIKFEGDHNSPRPQFYFDSINIFFHNVLQPPEVEVGSTFYGPMDDYIGKGSWSTMHELGYLPPSSAQKRLATSSISDAISKVRTKRPMSRTEVPSNIPTKDPPLGAKDSEDDDDDDDDGPSSDMISFDLSNGDPYHRHLATNIDDDQYVEYQFNDLADFPSNAEEEERMLMEAVMESLKDLEMQHHEKEGKSGIATDFARSEKEKETDVTSSMTEHRGPSRTESASTQTNDSLHPETDSASTSATNSQNVSVAEASVPCETPVSKPEPISTSAHSQTSGSKQDASDVMDMSANTKATVTVERSNTSSNVLDGLIRRWDFSFFKNR